MILEVGADSSIAARFGAAALLYLHIGGGLVGIVSGAGALVIKKGSRLHRLVGNVFFVSMLIMAAIGAIVSPFLPTPSWLNVAAGTVTLYMLVTSWIAAQRDRTVGRFEIGAFVFAIVLVAACVSIGMYILKHPTTDASQGPFPAFLFAAITTLAAIGDLRLILRKSLSAVQRLVRHLWRMCYALFIAVGSLFLGQPQVFPDAVRGTGLLFVPVLLVLLSLIYWLVRVRIVKRGLPLTQ